MGILGDRSIHYRILNSTSEHLMILIFYFHFFIFFIIELKYFSNGINLKETKFMLSIAKSVELFLKESPHFTSHRLKPWRGNDFSSGSEHLP